MLPLAAPDCLCDNLLILIDNHSFAQVLRGVPFLQNIDDSLFELIYAHGKLLRFEAGDMLFIHFISQCNGPSQLHAISLRDT